MRKVPGVDSSLIDGMAGSTIRTGDSAPCSETGSTAVPSRLKAELGSLAVGGEVQRIWMSLYRVQSHVEATTLQKPARDNRRWRNIVDKLKEQKQNKFNNCVEELTRLNRQHKCK